MTMKITLQERLYYKNLLRDKYVQLQYAMGWAEKHLHGDAKRNKKHALEAEIEFVETLRKKL